MVSTWRAWYADWSEYDSVAYHWWSLPATGLICVMLYFADGTRRWMGNTEYYWRAPDGTWGQGNERPLNALDHDVKRAPAACIPEEDYDIIVEAAFCAAPPVGT